MSDPITAIAGATGAITSLANTGLNMLNYDRNKKLQEETWKREDTAVQRRVSDLKAAGLSPVLAAGQAAQTAAPMRLDAPVVEDAASKASQSAQAAMNLIQQKANITKTVAETNVAVAQEKNVQSETKSRELANSLAEQTLEDQVAIAREGAFKAFSERQLKAQEWRLKALDVDQAQIELARKRLDQEKGFLDLTEREKDIAAKQVAIATAEHNLQFAQRAGLPTGMPNMAATLPAMGGNLLGALIEAASKMMRGGK